MLEKKDLRIFGGFIEKDFGIFGGFCQKDFGKVLFYYFDAVLVSKIREQKLRGAAFPGGTSRGKKKIEN